MSSPLEATRSLLRTAVRTFYPHPKQIFLFDALLTYNVLHVEDMVTLFPMNTTQAKEVRSLLNPLKAARLVTTGTKQEIKDGQTRSVQREHYYVNYHEAVDAIKYRIVKLQDRVQGLYKEAEGQRKDWWCPRCKAEYDELSILDKVDPDRGFYCERCGQTLLQNEAAVRERGEHAKIRILNDQLRPFNTLLLIIDSGEVPENDFETAWQLRRAPPETYVPGAATKPKWREVDHQKNNEPRKLQAVVDAAAYSIKIESEQEQKDRDAETKRIKAEQMAKQNALPTWHTQSAIRDDGIDVKKEGATTPDPLAGFKKEEVEKKPLAELGTEERTMQDEMDAYMADLERERREQERKDAEEEDDDDEDDDEFEDAGPSNVGTPSSSQNFSSFKQEVTPTKLNGSSLKRERDADGDSISGTDTGPNTPAASMPTSVPDGKRIKLENGTSANIPVKMESAAPTSLPQSNGTATADSDEDEDFEDV